MGSRRDIHCGRRGYIHRLGSNHHGSGSNHIRFRFPCRQTGKRTEKIIRGADGTQAIHILRRQLPGQPLSGDDINNNILGDPVCQHDMHVCRIQRHSGSGGGGEQQRGQKKFSDNSHWIPLRNWRNTTVKVRTFTCSTTTSRVPSYHKDDKMQSTSLP